MSDVSVQIPALAEVEIGIPCGAPGPAGMSAYDYAVAGGYSGTEAEFYADLGGVHTIAEMADNLKNVKAPVITDTASGAVAYIPDGADGLPVKSLTAEETAAAITVAGKNIFDESAANWKTGYLINASGEEVTSSGYKYSQTFFKVRPNTAYAVQINKGTTGNVAVTVPCYDADQDFLERLVGLAATTATGVMSGTFTTPSDCEYIRLNVPANQTTDIQVEVGAAATAYEAYKGAAYAVDAADIKTFPGVNNIWADTGDVTVEYRADTKLYIAKVLAAQ